MLRVESFPTSFIDHFHAAMFNLSIILELLLHVIEYGVSAACGIRTLLAVVEIFLVLTERIQARPRCSR